MADQAPTLHMVCGKVASGKSSLCAILGNAERTIVISEDEWLGALFGDQMSSLQDYARYAAKLRTALGPHIIAILRSGISVVMDYPANTISNRAWMRGLFEEAGASHQLHVLDIDDELCLARLRARNASGKHPFAATEEQFRRLAKHYVPPTPEEGFSVTIHRSKD